MSIRLYGKAMLSLGVAVAALTAAPSVLAQDAKPTYDRSKLEDVTVQTQKRVESAQTVPVAVTAFSGIKLEREFAVTLEDFNHSIPNVQLEHVGLFQAAASFSMRGIGTAGIESFADPVVAVFVDGVYYSRNAVSLLDLFDVEAIEVLRGPQGTLYGRNAFAGAISVRTHRPDMEEFSGSVEMDFGNAGRINMGIIANMPIVEGKVAMRVAANYHKLGGFYKNDGKTVSRNAEGGLDFSVDENLVGGRLNGEKSVYLRPSIRFTPNDKLDVSLIGEIWRDRGDGTTNWSQCYEPNSFPPPLGDGPSGTPAVHTLFGFPCVDPFGDKRFGIEGDGSDPFAAGFNLIPSRTNHDVWGITLDASYETSAGTFELTVNHRDVEEDVTSDTDGANYDLFSSSRIQEFDSTQADLKFVSSFSDKVDLIVGTFFLKDHYQVGQLLWIFADSDLFGGGGFSRDNPLMSYGENSQDRKSFAAYAQIDYHITDQFSLILGGRYTDEKKYNVMGMAINDSACPAGFVPKATVPEGDPTGANCNGAPFAGTDPGDFHDFNPAVQFGPQSASWSAFSPRVGLDYQLNDDVLLFAFWQRAHKSGGFVNNAGTPSVFASPFDQERVDNFEIGMKSDWLDNTLRLNINAFYAKYNDLQRGVIREADTSTGQETFTDNAAGAKSKGVELEFSWLPTDGLTIFGVVGWLDIEYVGFIADINGDGVETDNSGLDLVRAPKWDLQFGFNYDWDLGNSGLLNIGARLSYTSSMLLTTPNDVGFIRDPLTTIDANINWEPANGRYRISVWGKNLNGDIERLGGTPVATLFAFGAPTQPRQYGVSVKANF
jgi:iron complex outermembrane recepter protein